MLAKSIRRTILVPILDGDITEDTLRAVLPLISEDDTHLVLLHVWPEREVPRRRVRDVVEPRWRQLACAAPGRTFLEAIVGDPRSVVRSEAERFDTSTIVVGRPSPKRKHPRTRITHHVEA